MKNKNTIIETAKQTIIAESNAIANLVNFSTIDFENAVNFIHNSIGRLIATGIGKSAKIADKIVASLNSTGTPTILVNNNIVEIITDGDLRPTLKDNSDISALTAADIMSKTPKTIQADQMAIKAL